MRSFSRHRTSPSCAAPRIRRRSPRRRPCSASPASPSPTGTRSPASSAAISRRSRRKHATRSAAGSSSATARRTSPPGRPTAPPMAGSAGCSPPAISAPGKAAAISTSPTSWNGGKGWMTGACVPGSGSIGRGNAAGNRRSRALAEAFPGRVRLGATASIAATTGGGSPRSRRLAQRHGVPLLALGDVLYHAPDRRRLQDVADLHPRALHARRPPAAGSKPMPSGT